jgi:hypothetical protein
MLQRARQSIEVLHRFFEGWIGGTIEYTPENFGYLETAFAGDFTMVTPTGARQDRKQVLGELRNDWGAVPGIKIWIEDVVLLHEDRATIAALYTEHQSVNGTSNRRVSTALFRKNAGGLSWLFVQETLCVSSGFTPGSH